jgi:folate-binding protein YgfZ
MSIARLDDRAIIAVSGPEARAFLQGLITNDIEMLAPGHAIYAALLTPQGKILFDFLVAEGDGALLIDCAAERRDALVKRLQIYRLRTKVTIEPRDQLAVVASWGADEQRHSSFVEDPRVHGLGLRRIAARGEISASLPGPTAYHRHRVALGVPESDDFGSDKVFALDGDLDELGAISFSKGCYVGQELTARMKHRGTARKRLLPVATEGPDMPEVDAAVTANGRDLGEIRARYGDKGFALLRLDRLEEAGARDVEAVGVRLKVGRPNWLFA